MDIEKIMFNMINIWIYTIPIFSLCFMFGFANYYQESFPIYSLIGFITGIFFGSIFPSIIYFFIKPE